MLHCKNYDYDSVKVCLGHAYLVLCCAMTHFIKFNNKNYMAAFTY